MRVGGRLSRAVMPDNTKQQAILPKDSHITRLVLRHIHDVTAHAGRNHMLAQLKDSGSLEQMEPSEGSCHSVSFVKGYMELLANKLWQDLPKCRVLSDNPPFTRVGIDYFGPFLVKRGREQVKRYGVTFTSCHTGCASWK